MLERLLGKGNNVWYKEKRMGRVKEQKNREKIYDGLEREAMEGEGRRTYILGLSWTNTKQFKISKKNWSR